MFDQNPFEYLRGDFLVFLGNDKECAWGARAQVGRSTGSTNSYCSRPEYTAYSYNANVRLAMILWFSETLLVRVGNINKNNKYAPNNTPNSITIISWDIHC